MSSRFRTYFNGPGHAVSRQGCGVAALRRGAETAPAVFSLLCCTLLHVFFLITAPAPAMAAVPAGTVISNTAVATYADGPASTRINRNSNTVRVTTVARRTPSTTEFFSYAPLLPGAQTVTVVPGAYRPGSDPTLPFTPLALPVPAGSTTPIDLSKPVPLARATAYHAGEPVFVQVTDPDQNLDPSKTETIIITLIDSKTGDTEVILLTETGPDSGKFIGYIQSTANSAQSPYNGTLPVGVNSAITAKYTDIIDGSDSSTDAAMVDPYGIVFDSTTGKPVDGAKVTLINAATGSPASVFGDDGVSAFPATVTSGAAMVVNGTTYSFPPGGFRYPFVNPGQYRFQIVPPAGFSAPSTATDATLQALQGGPFALITPGSRQEQFTINPGPAIHIDIPVDPSSATLWLQKSAGKDIVATGDFLPYQLDLENTHTAVVAPGVVISDTLPLGMRYRQGSTKLNGAIAPDPVISADGRILTFNIGDLAPKASASIRFVVEVATGVRLGIATNQASARTTNGIISNLATAAVTVRSDFMQSQSMIMGEMIIGPCEAPMDKSKIDLSGIRILLEDGTYVITDKNGMYHFEGVKPGVRVVQLDVDSVPKKYDITSCEENSRFAGRSFSQFVDIQGGVLWRADFYLSLKPNKTGEVDLELQSSLQKLAPKLENSDAVDYSIPFNIGSVPVRNLRLIVMLADGLTYLPATSTLDNRSIAEPTIMEGVLTYNLGDYPENWQGIVRFQSLVPRAGSAGKLVTNAMFIFDTPEQNNVKTPVADNALARKSGEAPQPLSTGGRTAQSGAKGTTGEPPVIHANQLQQIKSVKRVAMPEIILFPHFPTFGAELSDADRQIIDNLSRQLEGLDIEAVTVTGHTDSVRIAPRSRHIYPDNFALSKARAQSAGRFLMDALHLPADKFIYAGKGMTEPVASNRSVEGKARNRRVEAKIRTVKPVETDLGGTVKVADNSLDRIVLDTLPASVPVDQDVKVPSSNAVNEIINEKDRSGVKSVSTVGLRPGEKWLKAKTSEDTAGLDMPEYTVPWLNKAEPGAAWLWPHVGFYPQIPNMQVAIKHDPRLTLKLYLNGSEIDPISFEGTLKREDNTIAVSTWKGIHTVDGDNVFEAVQLDEKNVETTRLTRTFHYSTPPVRAEFVPAKSILVADGKTPPIIAVRLTDKDGHPVQKGMTGEFKVEQPYVALQRTDSSLLLTGNPDKLKYTITSNGIALIELQPTTKANEAVLYFTFTNGSQEIRARLTPDYRDWILVGIAEGTVGYNTLSGHMENLQSSGIQENFYDKERLAFFAKGTIKGEWLLTMAYDSAKQRTGVSGNALFQTIDPNSFYTLYGDGTSQGYEAASQRKLYLKIERDQFYAMFGDYDTGLTLTELSRYSRRMNGIKSEYRSKDFEVTAFGSETAQAFVKEELRGDGTSGLYRLSRTGIVLNSEKITIESRDRFHSDVVTSSRPLSRFIDYSIDYDTGALFFKSPVPSKDDQLNPVYIVIEYEVATAGNDALTYGGRAGAKLLDGKLSVGATHIHEGQVSGDANLYGGDLTAQLAPGTKLRAEVATTGNDGPLGKTNGIAYLAEIVHTDKTKDAKAYYREQESGFGLGQQKQSETGTRKFGVEGGYKLNDKVTLSSQAYRQYTLATGAVRDFTELLASYNEKQYSLRSGVKYANDTLPDGSSASSVLGTFGASWRLLNEKLTLRIDHDQALFSKNNNTDFPTRTTLGVDYQVTKSVALFAQEELTYGAAADTNTTRAGVKSTPWTGGSISSSVVNDIREDSKRTFANVGLAQMWQINKNWAVDGGLDHNQTLRKKTGYQLNANVPPASGGEDFTAVSLGANYAEKKLIWSNRAEYRTSGIDDKWGVISGIINEQGLNWGWTTRLQILHNQAVGGTSKTDGNLRLGLAYRPPLTKWIVLDRLDLIVFDEKSPTTSTHGNRLVNNMNANYRPDRKTQLSIQYGAKYVLEQIDALDYSGYTDLVGIEGRYDITTEWDIGLRGSLLHSWASNQFAYSFGPSVGYNVMQNAWISVGYNLAGFKDRDFSAANYTAQGTFVQFRFKFDQNTVKETLKWMNHE